MCLFCLLLGCPVPKMVRSAGSFVLTGRRRGCYPRLMTDSTSSTNPRAIRYGEEARELAFAYWIYADRSLARAMRFIEENWNDDLGPVPSKPTVHRWINDGAWQVKADQAVAENFPHIQTRHTARLVALTDMALETYASALAGELDKLGPGVMLNRINAARDIVNLRGLGTAGARTDGAQLAPRVMPSATSGLEEQLTAQDRARRQRERLEAERQ